MLCGASGYPQLDLLTVAECQARADDTWMVLMFAYEACELGVSIQKVSSAFPPA